MKLLHNFVDGNLDGCGKLPGGATQLSACGTDVEHSNSNFPFCPKPLRHLHNFHRPYYERLNIKTILLFSLPLNRQERI